jgi:hypothetical protein
MLEGFSRRQTFVERIMAIGLSTLKSLQKNPPVSGTVQRTDRAAPLRSLGLPCRERREGERVRDGSPESPCEVHTNTVPHQSSGPQSLGNLRLHGQRPKFRAHTVDRRLELSSSRSSRSWILF